MLSGSRDGIKDNRLKLWRKQQHQLDYWESHYLQAMLRRRFFTFRFIHISNSLICRDPCHPMPRSCGCRVEDWAPSRCIASPLTLARQHPLTSQGDCHTGYSARPVETFGAFSRVRPALPRCLGFWHSAKESNCLL